MKNLIVILCLICVVLSGTIAFSQIKPEPVLHQTTEWRVSPSFAFDTICFLNILTGDSFYVDRYKEDDARFATKLTPAARKSLANLKRKIKDEDKQIVSAFLALPFSTVEANSLDNVSVLGEITARRANYSERRFLR